MFKRVIWTGVGYGLGVGSSMYVQKQVKKKVTKTVERYTPENVRTAVVAKSKDLADKAKVTTGELRSVVTETRARQQSDTQADDAWIDLSDNAPLPKPRKLPERLKEFRSRTVT